MIFTHSQRHGQTHGQDSTQGEESRNSGILQSIRTSLEHSRVGDLLLLKGLVTPAELQFALAQQKQSGHALGRVFVQNNIISRTELYGVLMRQTMLRLVATALICVLTLTVLSPRRAKAEIMDVPGKISVAMETVSFGKQSAAPGLFGSAEKRSGNLSAFTKWSGMFSRFDRQLKTASGKTVISDLQDKLGSYKELSLKQMAVRVNDLMNQRPYILDNKNWGQSDYWGTPIEFMQRGGDCEDFAIAKYTALRALGVPEERLRVAIVQDTYKNIPHAVLAVYTDEGLYILDNQIKTLVNGEINGRYRPIFSINRTAWWLHSEPDTTRVASR